MIFSESELQKVMNNFHTNMIIGRGGFVKVFDFGALGLVPLDQTQLSTMVHGTFGYLDPKYMQTNQLTEKSDLYSFEVVLVELLTGKKAMSYDRPEEERNLADLFLLVMKQERLFEILEDNVLMKVAMAAKSCLCVKGYDRPSMKEVSMELRIKIRRKPPPEPNRTYINVGFDSVKDRVMLPMGEGR
ncbi:Non-specific serine/threonine protein kinase [Handroanthus impetiginosus]|uniref:Non-specific serine/threonine protein kinase n=1 Tax=Handroanthus impetiginosus TaxID=429701 RepID=A0A2G9I0S2_9LAMI|nr:Non-specific serine/threonine protein kinase [Handroanthus impetiginosus]